MNNIDNSPVDNEESSAKRQWQEMREERMNNDQDRALQAPQEANTEKHINFLAYEEDENSDHQPSNKDDESPAKKQWQEMREEKINSDQDPLLQAPQEANTQKHVNFLETGEDDANDENE